jgi:hypothetical protein
MTKISTTPQGSRQADDKNAIRPFHVNIPEADLTELRRRINATKWPEREMVTDPDQTHKRPYFIQSANDLCRPR